MKKLMKVLVVMFIMLSFVGGGAASGSNAEPVMGAFEIGGGTNDFFGRYEIDLNLTSIPTPGERFLIGEALPNREWIGYSVQDLDYFYHIVFEQAFLDEAGYFPTSQAETERLLAVFNSCMKRMGRVILDWPRGEGFEFSFGIQEQGWVNPRFSEYLYPVDALSEEQHFRMILGTKERCPNITGDQLILNIENEENGWYKVYINAFYFSWDQLENFSKFFVSGQGMPGEAWVSYEVVNDYPCYYFRVHWPYADIFEFTFGIESLTGERIYVDPSVSGEYKYLDHLRINF